VGAVRSRTRKGPPGGRGFLPQTDGQVTHRGVATLAVYTLPATARAKSAGDRPLLPHPKGIRR